MIVFCLQQWHWEEVFFWMLLLCSWSAWLRLYATLHLCLYFQFKSTPSKNVSVVGWMVMMADDPEHPDLFLLTDSEKGRQHSHHEHSGSKNKRRFCWGSPVYLSLHCVLSSVQSNNLCFYFKYSSSFFQTVFSSVFQRHFHVHENVSSYEKSLLFH